MLLQVLVPGLDTLAGTANGSAHLTRSWAAISSSICCVSGVRGPSSAAMTSERISALSRESGSDELPAGSVSAACRIATSHCLNARATRGAPINAAIARQGAIHSQFLFPARRLRGMRNRAPDLSAAKYPRIFFNEPPEPGFEVPCEE